jgi:hypothetical protein
MAMINKEDIIELIGILDNYYVRNDVCNEIQTDNNSKFANDDKQIQLLEQKLSQWEWLFKLIATGTIGTLVTSVLALILK